MWGTLKGLLQPAQGCLLFVSLASLPSTQLSLKETVEVLTNQHLKCDRCEKKY